MSDQTATTFAETTRPVEIFNPTNNWAATVSNPVKTASSASMLLTTDGILKQGFLYLGLQTSDNKHYLQAVSEHPDDPNTASADLGADVVLAIVDAGDGIAIAAGKTLHVYSPFVMGGGSTLKETGVWVAAADIKWLVPFKHNQVLVCTSSSIDLVDVSHSPFTSRNVAKATGSFSTAPVPMGSRLAIASHYSKDDKPNYQIQVSDIGASKTTTTPVLGDAGTCKGLSTDGWNVFAAIEVSDSKHVVNAYEIQEQAGHLASLAPTWSHETSDRIHSNVLPAGDDVYFTVEKIIYGLAKSDGRQRIMESAAYVKTLRWIEGALYGYTDDKMFVYDPLKPGVVTAEYNQTGLCWLGNNHETIYTGYNTLTTQGSTQVVLTNVAARRWAEITRSFTVDIELLQDFVLDAHNKKANPVPSYQVEISLHDTNMAPRALEALRVQCPVQTQVKINGAMHSIGPDTSVEIRTDPVGRLVIELEANDLCAPPLLFWASFMTPEERFTVFPDFKTHKTLASLTGSQLFGAKDYDGKSILKSDYDSETNAGNIASAVTSTMNLSRTARVRDAQSMRYTLGARDQGALTLALSGADRHTIPATLPIAMPLGSPTDWRFEATGQSTHFEVLSAERAAAFAARATEATAEPRSFKLWEKLKSGATAVATVVVTGAQNAVAIINDSIVLTIHTMEHAAILAQSILRSVTTAMDKVVQAFSYVFDWDEIKKTNEAIKSCVRSAISALKDDQGQGAVGMFKQLLRENAAGLEEKISKTFDDLCARLGAAPMNTTSYAGRPDGEHAASVPQSSGVKQSWMMNKILGAIRTGDSTHSVPSLPQRVIDKVMATLGDIASTVVGNFREALKASAVAWGSITPSQFISGAAAAFLQSIKQLLLALIHSFVDTTEKLLELFNDLIDAVSQALDGHVSLPFIGKLAEGQLTWLDMITLPIAVPSTLALQLFSERRGERVNLAITQENVTIFVGVAGVLTGIAAAFAGAVKHVPVVGATVTFIAGLFEFVNLSLVVKVAVLRETGSVAYDFIMAICNMLGCFAGGLVVPWCQLRSSAPGEREWFYVVSALGAVGLLCIGLTAWAANQIGHESLRSQRARIAGNVMSPLMRLLDPLPSANWPDLKVSIGLALLYCLIADWGYVGTSWIIIEYEPDAPPAAGTRTPWGSHSMLPPETAPSVSVVSGHGTTVNLSYAVTFFDRIAETARGPWSPSKPVLSTQTAPVAQLVLPKDPTGIARGRRIYRLIQNSGARLVGEVDDNTTTAFSDDFAIT